MPENKPKGVRGPARSPESVRHGPRVAVRPEIHCLLKAIAKREQVAIAVAAERAIIAYALLEDAEAAGLVE